MRRRSSAALACIRAGISSENSSSRRSGILLTLPWRGRVACRRQAGWGDRDDVVDGLKHSVGPAHHIVIPKSYHSIAFRLQPARPFVVAAKPLIISVLRSIDLDDQPLRQ